MNCNNLYPICQLQSVQASLCRIQKKGGTYSFLISAFVILPQYQILPGETPLINTSLKEPLLLTMGINIIIIL